MGIKYFNEKYHKKLLLLDTCTYERFTKGDVTSCTTLISSRLATGNYCISITDLSFAELVEGRQTLSDFDAFRQDFVKYGFHIYGHTNIIVDGLCDAIEKQFASENDYQLFRQKVVIRKLDNTKLIFKDILLKYIILLLTVLAYEDNAYFSPLQNILMIMLDKDYETFDSIMDKAFEKITSFDKKDKKDSLLMFSTDLMEAFAKIAKPNYIDNEIHSRIERLDLSNNLSTYTSKSISELKKKAELKHLRKYNNVDFLIHLLSLNKKFKLLEDNAIFDGTSYAVINAGFCSGKFQFNDLVDIYNAAFVWNCLNECEYFTEENRWSNFLNGESKRLSVNPIN